MAKRIVCRVCQHKIDIHSVDLSDTFSCPECGQKMRFGKQPESLAIGDQAADDGVSPPNAEYNGLPDDEWDELATADGSLGHHSEEDFESDSLAQANRAPDVDDDDEFDFDEDELNSGAAVEPAYVSSRTGRQKKTRSSKRKSRSSSKRRRKVMPDDISLDTPRDKAIVIGGSLGVFAVLFAVVTCIAYGYYPSLPKASSWGGGGGSFGDAQSGPPSVSERDFYVLTRAPAVTPKPGDKKQEHTGLPEDFQLRIEPLDHILKPPPAKVSKTVVSATAADHLPQSETPTPAALEPLLKPAGRTEFPMARWSPMTVGRAALRRGDQSQWLTSRPPITSQPARFIGGLKRGH